MSLAGGGGLAGGGCFAPGQEALGPGWPRPAAWPGARGGGGEEGLSGDPSGNTGFQTRAGTPQAVRAWDLGRRALGSWAEDQTQPWQGRGTGPHPTPQDQPGSKPPAGLAPLPTGGCAEPSKPGCGGEDGPCPPCPLSQSCPLPRLLDAFSPHPQPSSRLCSLPAYSPPWLPVPPAIKPGLLPAALPALPSLPVLPATSAPRGPSPPTPSPAPGSAPFLPTAPHGSLSFLLPQSLLRLQVPAQMPPPFWTHSLNPAKINLRSP